MISTTMLRMNLDQIADSGQCFRMNKIDDKTYSLVASGRYIELRQKDHTISFSCEEDEFNTIWSHYFDMYGSYSNILSGISYDPYLLAAVEYGEGIRILHQDLFECILSFIISQQKSIPCIKQCVENICKKYGHIAEGTSFDNKVISAYTFPSTEDMKDIRIEDLADLRLGYRDKYIYSAIRWFLDCYPVLNHQKLYDDYEYAMQNLKEIQGVGDKVANCICLFALHHLNACPIDVHMNRLIQDHYSGTSPIWMKSPYAGVIQQYCFYYIRNH